MGKIYKIFCNCGESKKIYTGGGIASCNINTINRLFSEEKLKEFYNYYNNKEVQGFFVENELSICLKCKEFMTVSILKAELINNRKLEIINDCSKCGEKTQILNDLDICPICNKEMIKDKVGHWD